MYHIYTRGKNGETIFRSKENYHYFLGLYRKYMLPYTDTFAYCLLPNHVHFLIRIKDEDSLKSHNADKLISVQQQLAHLLNAYTKAFNIWHNRKDGLFQYRFRRKHVTSEAYFSRLVFYIHFNPQHHNLLSDFTDWPYSSYHSLLSKSRTGLNRDEVLDWFGGTANYSAFHQNLQPDLHPISHLVDDDLA